MVRANLMTALAAVIMSFTSMLFIPFHYVVVTALHF